MRVILFLFQTLFLFSGAVGSLLPTLPTLPPLLPTIVPPNSILDDILAILASPLASLVDLTTPANIPSCDEVTLTAKKIGSLPVNASHMVAAFDNVLSVYLFGGLTNIQASVTPLNTIYKFDVLQNTIQSVGTIPEGRYSGFVMQDGQLDQIPTLLQNVAYAGVGVGNATTDPVYKFDTVSNSISTLGAIPKINEGVTGSEGLSHQGYIFGGQEYDWSNITRIDLKAGNITDEGNLIFGLPGTGIAKYNVISHQVLIVGAGISDTQVMTRMMSYNQTTQTSEQAGAVEDLPDLDHPGSAFSPRENLLWVVGGYEYDEDSEIRNDGIYELDMNGMVVNFIPVTGLPNNGDWWFSAGATVYIPSLWKILIFGGWFRNSADPANPGWQTSDIYEINLTGRMCCGQESGFLPVPDTCANFVGCAVQLGGQALSELQCPNYLGIQLVGELCLIVNNLTCVLADIIQQNPVLG